MLPEFMQSAINMIDMDQMTEMSTTVWSYAKEYGVFSLLAWPAFMLVKKVFNKVRNVGKSNIPHQDDLFTLIMEKMDTLNIWENRNSSFFYDPKRPMTGRLAVKQLRTVSAPSIFIDVKNITLNGEDITADLSGSQVKKIMKKKEQLYKAINALVYKGKQEKKLQAKKDRLARVYQSTMTPPLPTFVAQALPAYKAPVAKAPTSNLPWANPVKTAYPKTAWANPVKTAVKKAA